jgi:hypothetical protein
LARFLLLAFADGAAFSWNSGFGAAAAFLLDLRRNTWSGAGSATLVSLLQWPHVMSI